MVGTGIFTFIGFFFWTVVNLVRRIGSDDWPIIAAIVSTSERADFGWGCTVIVIRYKYRNAEKRCDGMHKEPFIFDNYAEAYLRRFPGGSEFPVRVNPEDPSNSIPADRKIVFTRVE